MKNIFYTILCFTLLSGLVSCNNGDYIADPDSNGNAAVNPITPLTSSEFTWFNSDVIMSAKINGSYWAADHVDFALDTSGSNVLIGTKDGDPNVIQLYLRDVWGPDNVYPMEWENYSRFGVYLNATSFADGGYFSYLGNSGGIKVTANDTAVLKAMFYFKGVTADQKVVTVSDGVINIVKP
jgi:hypothetical protein